MKNDVKALIAGALGITMVFAVIRAENAPPAWTTRGAAGTESASGVAKFIFGDYVLPFEVLSVVLLVALIGSIVLARRESPEGDEK